MKKDIGIAVIDMQEGFEEGMSNKRRMIKAHQRLFEFAKKKHVPIFYLKYKECGEILPELQKMTENYDKTNVIDKYNTDGFIVGKKYEGDFWLLSRGEIKMPGEADFWGDSHLDYELKEKGIKNLVITGVNRGSCTTITAKSAKERGYEIFTANTLMNNPKVKYEKSNPKIPNQYQDWFMKESNYFDSERDLIDELSK